jgi:hypothetical protein
MNLLEKRPLAAAPFTYILSIKEPSNQGEFHLIVDLSKQIFLGNTRVLMNKLNNLDNSVLSASVSFLRRASVASRYSLVSLAL